MSPRFFPVSVRITFTPDDGIGVAHITDADAIRDLNEILGTSRYQVQALEASQFVVASTAARMIPSNTPTQPEKKHPHKIGKQKPRKKR